MRLSNAEINTIKTTVLELDLQAHVFLFGSRVDDSKRGGDIDLLIESKKISKQDLRTIRRQFYAKFGEQKMDLIIDNDIDNQAFISMIKPKSVPL
jgi:predicted nucleotidyltransferase